VAKHVGNVLHKLGVPSRTAAATFALRRGPF
jgi:DNA-binding NarL/FixJ family response regulator